MPDIAHQYRIITSTASKADEASGAVGTVRTVGAGWRRRTDRGRLRFTGADRISFLQALVTNDIEGLAPGRGAYAAYLTPQGRMITDLRIYPCSDHVLADVPAALASRLAATFDQLVFSEDVQVADVSAIDAQLSVCGDAAASVVSRACGLSVDAVRALPVAGYLEFVDGVVARTDESSLDSYDLFVPAANEDAIARRLVEAGATPLSVELADAMRIDAGRPAFGVDMNEETIPLEAGLLDRAISTTKGCYVGQEIVIRVLHRGGGRVAKRLVRLTLDAGAAAPPTAGTSILFEGHETGRITSAAWSPTAPHIVALGYVHRDVAEVGKVVEVAQGIRATVTGLAG